MVVGFLKLHVSLSAWRCSYLSIYNKGLYPVDYFTGNFDVDFCIWPLALFFQDPDADYQDEEDDPAQKLEVNKSHLLVTG